MIHTARKLAAAALTDADPLGVRCPTCLVDPGALCTGPQVIPSENRPTATPQPNRPDRTLDDD